MKKESRLLRIGVLGCGPISQFAHFEACRKARNAELYAICDVAEDLVAKMAAIHEPRVTYFDFDQMLSDPHVEAVIIAVADQFHIPLCLKAIAAGKHVLVEKPLGVTVEECEVLCDAARKSGLILQVGNNRRFDPGVTFAKDFIREEIGDILALKATYCDSIYRYTMTDNLLPIPVISSNARRPAGNPKKDLRRYFMLAHGSHLVDTARFLGGEIVGVHGRLVEKHGAYCWFVEVDFANGSLGHLDLNIPRKGDVEETFQVYGENGSISGRLGLTFYHKSGFVECYSVKDGQFHRPMGEDAHTYKRQIEGFSETILDGIPMHGAGIEDGVAAMRTMVAIARSVETGKKVLLADAKGGV
jgi:predicted dehydrogenase